MAVSYQRGSPVDVWAFGVVSPPERGTHNNSHGLFVHKRRLVVFTNVLYAALMYCMGLNLFYGALNEHT